MKRVWIKLSNTIHCTHGQLFVLHCPLAAGYHSGKDSPLLLKFPQNSKSMKNSKAKISASYSFCCCCIDGAHPWSQRHFKADNYIYSVSVKTTEML
jgi:hypothetical protein